MRLCLLWLGQEEAHKQLIWSITFTDMCFYLEYFVQVNKSDVIISVSFSDFGCLFSVAISGTKTDLHERSRRSDRKRKRERQRVRAYVHHALVSPLAQVLIYVSLLVLNFEQGYAIVSLCARALKRPSALSPITFGYNVTMSVPSHLSCLLLAVIHS